MIFTDLFNCDVFAHRRVHDEVNSHDVSEGIAEFIDDCLGQTVVRNAVLQHAARFFMGVINCHVMACSPQVERRGQAAGTGADDGCFLSGFMSRSCVEFFFVGKNVISERSFNGRNVDGFPVYILVACFGAQMRADSGSHHRHRIDAEEDFRSSVPVVFPDFRHVGSDIGSGRAGFLAGGSAGGHAAENGMVSVFTGNRVAGFAAFSSAVETAADFVGITVIPASDILADIAADGGGGPDQRRSDGMGSFGQSRDFFIERFIFTQVFKGCSGADHEALILFADVIGIRDVFD